MISWKKPNVILEDRKGTCLPIDVHLLYHKNILKKEDESIMLRYLLILMQLMRNMSYQ
jgi:hypothetical protein